MDDLLSLSAGLPEREFDAGEVILTEGAGAGALWVLVEGVVEVSRSGLVIDVVTRPGAVLGEVSVLLGLSPSATVKAAETSKLRYAEDGPGFIFSRPEITRSVTLGLAERLNSVTAYLADLQTQYGDAPGLTMAPRVTARLAERRVPPARGGSMREPNPPY